MNTLITIISILVTFKIGLVIQNTIEYNDKVINKNIVRYKR